MLTSNSIVLQYESLSGVQFYVIYHSIAMRGIMIKAKIDLILY